MKKFTAPLTLALACIVYGLVVVCEFHFAARAQGATNTCNTDSSAKIDALNQKALAQRVVVERITRDSKPYSFSGKKSDSAKFCRVRFASESGHWEAQSECPLRAISEQNFGWEQI